MAWAAVAVPWNSRSQGTHPGKQNSQDHEPQQGNEWLGCGTPGERPSGEKEHRGWQLFEDTWSTRTVNSHVQGVGTGGQERAWPSEDLSDWNTGGKCTGCGTHVLGEHRKLASSLEVGSRKPFPRDVKNNKGFYRYVSQKRKTKEIVLPPDK